MAKCRVCDKTIDHGEEVRCSILACYVSYHSKCAGDLACSSKKFKCRQHACFLCKTRGKLWKCSKCDLATHETCAAYPEYVIHTDERLGKIICWRHPTDCSPVKAAVPNSSIEEFFSRLPLPTVEEEFKLDLNMENSLEANPYVHIEHNIYEKKRNNADSSGCTICDSELCNGDCACSTDGPFGKGKTLNIYMTPRCGWGVEAGEFIKKGDFIIEYVGEVIDDAEREKRFWDMSDEDAENFYMCEVREDFTIDATFVGNESRFLNHSCDPNSTIEKWDVNGETRLGVFASKPIMPGDEVTFDYRFVQLGEDIDCRCGAPNCYGFIGLKKKIIKPLFKNWGDKRRRRFIR